MYIRSLTEWRNRPTWGRPAWDLEAYLISYTYELEVEHRISQRNDFDGRQIRKKHGCDWLILRAAKIEFNSC
jgi:hypothetical protein